jgi:hypothetical protein
MKSPPVQFPDDVGRQMTEDFIDADGVRIRQTDPAPDHV